MTKLQAKKLASLDNKELQQLLLKVCKIPAGKVTTYKNLAAVLNSKAYRHIGTLLGKNPFLIEIPCHRVVRSTGDIGGYAKGTKEKIRLLKAEGLQIKAGKVCNLNDVTFNFK